MPADRPGLREAVIQAIEVMAAPLGRARVRGGLEQERDLRSVANGMGILRSALAKSASARVRPITQKEAAARLGVHPNTVATMLDDGRLEAVDVGSGGGPSGGCRRVSMASLKRLASDSFQAEKLRGAAQDLRGIAAVYDSDIGLYDDLNEIADALDPTGGRTGEG